MKPSSMAIAWLWFQANIPDEWELTGFSTNPDKGQLQFFTRKGFQAQVQWRKVKDAPDVDRIISEVCRRHMCDVSGDSNTPVPPIDFSKQKAFTIGCCPLAGMTLASTYIREVSVMVEWSFPWTDIEQRRQTLPIVLNSFITNVGRFRHWAVHGLAFRLPEEFQLNEFQSFPGSQIMSFKSAQKSSVVVRQWALPYELLGTRSIDSFGKFFMAKLFRKVISCESKNIFGHDGAVITFKEKGKIGMDRLVASWWQGQCMMWHDRDRQRIFSFDAYGPSKNILPELKDAWL